LHAAAAGSLAHVCGVAHDSQVAAAAGVAIAANAFSIRFAAALSPASIPLH